MELRDILDKWDFTVELGSTVNLGNKLTRQEVEDTIIANGYPLPEHSIRFHIYDDEGKVFSVRYSKARDSYAYEKLSVAG